MDIIKNLNKKVGYALIAASLLAVSSVQGSVTDEQGQIGEHLRSSTFKTLSGKELKVYYPEDCVLKELFECCTFDGTKSIWFLILVKKDEADAVPEGFTDENASGDFIIEKEFDDVIIAASFPDEFTTIRWLDGNFYMIPKGLICRWDE